MGDVTSMPAPPRPRVEVLDADGATVVAVRGEIDLACVEELTDGLLAAIDEGDSVLVDLCACTFIDSTGLSSLLSGLRRAKDRGVPYAVACQPGGAPRSLFDMVLGHGFFVSCDDRASGLAALRRAS